MGIRAKLVFCLLVVLIPLCVASTFAIQLFEQQLQREAQESLTNSQRLETLRISEILDRYAYDARSLATNPKIREFVSAIDSYVAAIQANPTRALTSPPIIGGHSGLAEVDISAPKPLQQLARAIQKEAASAGSTVADLRIVSRTGMNLGQTQTFTWQATDKQIAQRAMASANIVFGNAFVSEHDQQRIGMVSPIVSDAGEIVGALLLETPLTPISKIIAMHERTGRTSEALLTQRTTSGDAQIITSLRYDRTSAFSKVLAGAADLPTTQALDSQEARFLETTDYRGIESLASIQTIPATGWGLVVKINKNEAYAPLQALKKVLAIAAAITLLLVILGYSLCLLPVAHRLKKTAYAAHKITQGDLSVRVCDKANDEIGNMARTIDNLAQQLQQDHQKRAVVEEQLQHQATHDELTGLLNRKYANKLIADLNNDLSKSHTVMFLDLNGFKSVNDFYGHAVGDEVLKTVAERLVHATPINATLARWGGDEFVIVLPDTDYISADIFSSYIHAAFETLIPTEKGNHEISTSIGIATSNPGKSLQEALVEADSLMYEEKAKHKSSRSVASMAVSTLERALLEDRIELWYEPIIKSDSQGTESLYGADVKIRIRTTEGGIVLPEELLNTIGKSPLAASLYKHVLAACTKSTLRWIESKIVSPEFQLHFDTHSDLLANKQFIETTIDFFTGFEQTIARQITFTTNAYSPHENQQIAQLKSLGISIATHHSNMLDPPANNELGKQREMCKVDIGTLDSGTKEQRLTAKLNTPNTNLCVYGITSRKAISKLTPLGIELFQGELFDRPLRPVDFICRWGKPSENHLIQLTNSSFTLRLAG